MSKKALLVRLLFLLILMVMTFGCASFTRPAREHRLEDNKAYWFDYDASRRGAILIPNNSNNIRICAEPSPDVALAIIDKFKANVTQGGITAGGEVNIQQDVIQLAKRTQTIMFLRESLYRLCELCLNSQLRDDEVKALYKTVIDAAKDMAVAELRNAEQDKIQSEIKLEEIKKLSLSKYKDEEDKIDSIINFVKTQDLKVDKDNLGKLIPNTGLDENWIDKYAGKDVFTLWNDLKSEYRSSVEALASNIR